ncbi:hypothetical protein HAZT_HAZT004140 [Hyalella azteca]|uniref:Eukaryotic peptide chain release factor subunit 1 n=1 Tax=Hyalella azteca TaxID=294128 RepID=A0A6A0GPT7_HYAAZ|nr:eukaryotic peptide chain release factor subunit 1-like [Hyalella azteca]KAA0184060.1 hypothetical protein HAZT_HAZT004140 [Hyalella azteca]
MTMESDENHLETWRLRRRLNLIESLKPAPNTSVFTILIRPDDHITKIRSMLADEQARSSNIKSDTNRISVQDGLKIIIEHLRVQRHLPKNGLACYCGTSVFDPNCDKSIKLKMFFEPPKPITRFIYDCGFTFHTSTLRTLLNDEQAVGYIVIDGKGTLFASVRGSVKDVLFKMSVDLPRKHARGGQSAARFARIREDARLIYISQVCEKAVQVFIKNNIPCINQLIIAGQAHLKDCIEKCPRLDVRLKPLICSILTVDYGGEAGLNDAIRQSMSQLASIKLSKEITLIRSFFDLLSRGQENLVAYGPDGVTAALEEGAVETVIVWQDLALVRWVIQKDDSTTIVEYLETGKHPKHETFVVKEDGISFVEWLADHVKSWGCKLELVSDATPEGAMLVGGFRGIAALLRYSREPAPNLLDDSDHCFDLDMSLCNLTY